MEAYVGRLIKVSVALLIAGIAVMYLTGIIRLLVPFVTGWLISFINAVAGMIVITRAFETEGKGFFNKILLSMVVRMFAIVIVVALLIVILKIDKINLAVSLFLFYFLFLVMEIRFLQDRQENLKNVQQ